MSPQLIPQKYFIFIK